MAVMILVPPPRPHPSSVERRRRGKWLQTAPQEPKITALTFNTSHLARTPEYRVLDWIMGITVD